MPQYMIYKKLGDSFTHVKDVETRKEALQVRRDVASQEYGKDHSHAVPVMYTPMGTIVVGVDRV